jgi:hypothetical protein
MLNDKYFLNALLLASAKVTIIQKCEKTQVANLSYGSFLESQQNQSNYSYRKTSNSLENNAKSDYKTLSSCEITFCMRL